MKKKIKKLIDFFTALFGFKIISLKTLNNLVSKEVFAEEFKFILKYGIENGSLFLKNKELSKSQIGQDLFVLSELNYKKNGFFVEFGATDGISFSNTFLLEKEFNWNGILAEPAKCHHEKLKINRNVSIETNCVWSYSGKELFFLEVDKSSLSTIEGFENEDAHIKSRQFSKKYKIETISLIDMLKKYNAPKIIDYLSIDTEGSEFEILEKFNFDKYKFRIITVEHNYTAMRKYIYDLLISKGYSRVNQEYSQFDDWYIYKA